MAKLDHLCPKWFTTSLFSRVCPYGHFASKSSYCVVYRTCTSCQFTIFISGSSPSSRVESSRRTSRFFFGAGMSEYAPKLIFDFNGILSTFSNHISSHRLGVGFFGIQRRDEKVTWSNSNRTYLKL